ncbi:peptide ABC transporter substrate-binding protein, partial [Selenomonadales bacterium OttesenSCG-928-I06]|nr:peptide ABC transporter substrate-binding protein [Selenomonadales bacterium OttesenSCG-928-I06]
MQKKIVLLIALILIFLNFSGCTSHKQKDIETLKIACGGDPETLDPRKASGIIEGTVLRQIYEGLFTHDKDGKVVPGTAEKHDVSEDGLIYTFYIREDARWSNGDHVTAHDYAYSWTKTLDPNFAAKYADLLFCIKNGEKYNKGEVSSQELGIEVLGDRTLRVTLEYPASYFLYLTTFFTYYPVHKKTAEEISKWHTNPDTVICNGPFKIVSFKHNDRINLTRNDFYHSSQIVKMKNVQINLSDNNKTILDMFEDNQLDTAEVKIPLSEVARLKQDGRLKTYPFIGTYYYCINTKKPPFDDVRVRKAFALALNREDIVKYITKADEKVALAWVPYGLSDYLE